VVPEFSVAEQRASQTSRPNQKGILGVIPAQEILNPAHQVSQRITHFRLSRHPGTFEILADLRRVEVQLLSDQAARYELCTGVLHLPEQMVVGRQAPEGGFGNRFKAGSSH
jgi:hypothetical protein